MSTYHAHHAHLMCAMHTFNTTSLFAPDEHLTQPKASPDQYRNRPNANRVHYTAHAMVTHVPEKLRLTCLG